MRNRPSDVCAEVPGIVDPGSVGSPADDDEPYPHVIEAGTPEARYAVVDDTTGSWEVTFHDIEAAAAAARANDRPDVEHALRTGCLVRAE